MSIHFKDYVPTVESPPPDIRKLWFSDMVVKVMHDTKLQEESQPIVNHRLSYDRSQPVNPNCYIH
jgi:hypothetical protein